MSRIKFIYNGGRTNRYHTVNVIKSQTVAEHSFGVAWFCYLISGTSPSSALLLAALSHDLAEHEVGDVTAPAKRNDPALKELIDRAEHSILAVNGLNFPRVLTEQEKRTLKLADCFDGMMFCIRERKLGNKDIDVVFKNFDSYVVELHPRDREEYIYLEVYNLWLEALK